MPGVVPNSIFTVIPVAALTFAVWCVYLGGLAALQANCDSTGGLTTHGLTASTLPCSRAYRYWWFVMAFELVIVVLLFIAGSMTTFFHTRAAFIGLFAVGLVLYIQASDNFLNGESVAYYQNGQPHNIIRTVTAGAIMVALMNAIVILVVGMHDGHVERNINEAKAANVANNPV